MIYLDRVCGLTGSQELALKLGSNDLVLPGRLAVELPMLICSLLAPESFPEEALRKIAGGAQDATWAIVAKFGHRRFRIRRALEASSVILDAQEQGSDGWFVSGKGAHEVEARLRSALQVPPADDLIRYHIAMVSGAPDEPAFGEHGVERRAEPLWGAERRDALALLDRDRALATLKERIEALESRASGWMQDQSRRLDPTGGLAKVRETLMRTEGARTLSTEEEELLRRGPQELEKLEEQIEEMRGAMGQESLIIGEPVEPPPAIEEPKPWYQEAALVAGLLLTLAFTISALTIDEMRWLLLGNILSFGGVAMGALRTIQRFEDYEQATRHQGRAKERIDALVERRDRVGGILDKLRAELGDHDVATWKRMGLEREQALIEYAEWEPKIRAHEASPEWKAFEAQQLELETVLHALKAKRSEIPPPDPSKVQAIQRRFEDSGDDFYAELASQWVELSDNATELHRLISLGFAEVDDEIRGRISRYLGRVWCRLMGVDSADLQVEPRRLVIDGVGSDSWDDSDERYVVAALALKIALIAASTPQLGGRNFLMRVNVERRLRPETQAALQALEATLSERVQSINIKRVGL